VNVPANESKFGKVLSLLGEGVQEGLHLGAQLYISRAGECVANFSVGQAAPGISMTPGILMLWLSSGKPLTAVAIAQQVERAKLDLEDNVARFIPEFGQKGKQSITVAHLLTHTGGFRAADEVPEELGWEETIRRVCETPIEPSWVPGEKAGYQSSSSWFILGEIVRRLDGRPYSEYVREELLGPLDMKDSWLGMPQARYHGYGNRIGKMFTTEKMAQKEVPFWSSEAGCVACRPGSNARGPIQELGKFYEALLKIRNGASGILKPETVRLFTSRQRSGMFDQTFGHALEMGHGFILAPEQRGPIQASYGYGRHASNETFGHSGAQSSCAFADPKHELVVAWAFNGMPGEKLHQRRARALNSAIYEDLNLA
jgi:CubicO group peptidase (beta-lactamase class C family)